MTGEQVTIMTLKDAQEGKEYLIQRIETDDEELDAFLFSLCDKNLVVFNKNTRSRNSLFHIPS